MDMYIQFELDYVTKGIETALLPYAEQEYNRKELLNLIEEQLQRHKLLQLISMHSTIWLGDLNIQKTGVDRWKLKDRRPTARRYILQVLNNLPWPVETQVNLDSDKVIENIINTEREIEKKEFGDYCSEYTENETDYFKQKAYERFGKYLIIDFTSIQEVLKIIDDSIGELYFK